jgi:hypothetical protein
MWADQAASEALKVGRALCKIISRNDVGATGAHQCGFYLPKQAWELFSPSPPTRGHNFESSVEISWPEGVRTDSVVKWYGVGTRKEFRLTRFGRKFPWLREQYVGSLLVLIPLSLKKFNAWVLQTEEEIENFQSSLGIETLGSWGIYAIDRLGIAETEDECLKRVFTAAISELDQFPTGARMAALAREAVEECTANLKVIAADETLLKLVAAEFQLFRMLEHKLCLAEVQKTFASVDEFISIAATVMNRRKSRAGHSLEHHVEYLLKAAGVPFDRQPRIDGKVKPDLLIPGKDAYEDPNFPSSRLVVVGLKTTCKDRWRQILNEGRRIPVKHLLTLQEAISSDQLREMREANVTLVVPEPYHSGYDKSVGIRLLSVRDFIRNVRC